MQGQVDVPYTGIGGLNMDMGIMLMDDATISGSTAPRPSGTPTGGMRVMWTYPGGINLTSYNGQGAWGYAVYTLASGGELSTDATIRLWLQGLCKEAYVQPEKTFTEDEIDAGGPEVIQGINNLLVWYVYRLLGFEDGSDLRLFQDSFPGCWERI